MMLSVVIQIAILRTTRKTPGSECAPFHHHFELAGCGGKPTVINQIWLPAPPVHVSASACSRTASPTGGG